MGNVANINPPTPTVEVPSDTDMALEPATEIGDIFASKLMLQPIIAAAVAIIAMTLKMNVDDDLVDNLTTIVMFLAAAWSGISAQLQASKRAKQQGAATREVVYAPATVEQKVIEAAQAGNADIVVVAPSEWGINRNRAAA